MFLAEKIAWAVIIFVAFNFAFAMLYTWWRIGRLERQVKNTRKSVKAALDLIREK